MSETTLPEISTAVSPAVHPDSDLATGDTWSRWVMIASVALTFVLCYLRNFVLPNTPIMWWGDQMLFATNGTRILAGQMPYRDYFQFLTPGTDLVYALLFRWLGTSLWIPNMLMACLASAAVLLMMLAARKVLRGAFLLLPALFMVGFGLYGGMDATHHWFSAIVAMTAMLVLMRGMQTRHIAVAGVLCGVAISFTQSRGTTVTIGFLVYLIWKSIERKESAGIGWRRCLLLCGSAVFSFLVINIRFIQLAGVGQWVRCVIVFPFRYYPSIPGQTWRTPWQEIQDHTISVRSICIAFVYAVVPLVYLAFLRVMSRRRKIEQTEPWDQLLLIAITGLSMFLSVAPGLTIMRVSSTCMPGMILLAWFLSRHKRPVRLAGGLFAALSLGIALYVPIQTQRTQWNYLDLPAGRTAILDPGRYQLFRLIAEQTHPGQAYFGVTHISLPVRLECTAPIEAPGPWEYYRPEQITASIDAIERDHIQLLVLPRYLKGAGQPGYSPDRLRSLQDYVAQHYVLEKSFPYPAVSYDVWTRRD
jgi:hypothetical protein